jgi:hypothetical protein
MRSQEMPVSLARTSFISLLNPAFAVTQLDYNRAVVSYRTEGSVLGAAHLHFPRLYAAAGTFVHYTPQQTGGGVHASYHTILLNRFHLTGGGMVYTHSGKKDAWRGRYGITISGGEKRYWIAGVNVDQSFHSGQFLPGFQWLQTVGRITRSVSMKWVLTAQQNDNGKAEVFTMPLWTYRGAWQGGVGYYVLTHSVDQWVARISYKRFGWWSLLAGWPAGHRLKSTVIECCFQKSF